MGLVSPYRSDDATPDCVAPGNLKPVIVHLKLVHLDLKSVIPDLYGCLPDSKKNLRCVVKKSAAFLYPALIA